MRPLIFTPCERVVMDKATGCTTIVQIMEVVNLEVPNLAVPPDIMFNIRWQCFTFWLREHAAPAEYEQQLSLLSPAGALVVKASLEFKFVPPNDQVHQVLNVFEAFPAAAGVYQLQLLVRPKGTEHFELMGSYPIRVAHNEPRPTPRPDVRGLPPVPGA